MSVYQDPALSSLIALAWCLAWGNESSPQVPIATLEQMRSALRDKSPLPESMEAIIQQIEKLQGFGKLPDKLNSLDAALISQETPVGLVYGGATKIKGYLFESGKFPDIRGASALLDIVNLVDLPAFFKAEGPDDNERGDLVRKWLDTEFPGLSEALCPELVVYSTGGNILALCPAAFVNQLADAIEKRYTTETLTANSCAVGHTFRLLEFRLGLLKENIQETFWLDQYKRNQNNPKVTEYYGKKPEDFQDRKSFNELVGVLASDFNRRRNGNLSAGRVERRFPPIFETHPYLQRDTTDRRSAIGQADSLPDTPYFSEPLARKRIVGQIAKRDTASPYWFEKLNLDWKYPSQIESWVSKFEDFLEQPENTAFKEHYYKKYASPREALTLQDIGDVSDGFVGHIYADGNNMGGYIRKIRTQEEYRKFSRDVTEATETAVYRAIARHLCPHRIRSGENAGRWIHPFEILTIGGDDVSLVVPANCALEITQTIGEEFEAILCEQSEYLRPSSERSTPQTHRYRWKVPALDRCQLSISSGVLIAGADTPIYYAQKLVDQLLKSAKERAKKLKSETKYYGGTVDFLSLKSVTMLSETVGTFRDQGLKNEINGQELRLYAAPYTLHEIGGLLDTVRALKEVNFPKSQLYQIRGLLERGRRTAILNYRYFRVRFKKELQGVLKERFEQAWCDAQTNEGNLAPWMSIRENGKKAIYETIWRDIVDLYPFVVTEEAQLPSERSPAEAQE